MGIHGNQQENTGLSVSFGFWEALKTRYFEMLGAKIASCSGGARGKTLHIVGEVFRKKVPENTI